MSRKLYSIKCFEYDSVSYLYLVTGCRIVSHNRRVSNSMPNGYNYIPGERCNLFRMFFSSIYSCYGIKLCCYRCYPGKIICLRG